MNSHIDIFMSRDFIKSALQNYIKGNLKIHYHESAMVLGTESKPSSLGNIKHFELISNYCTEWKVIPKTICLRTKFAHLYLEEMMLQ